MKPRRLPRRTPLGPRPFAGGANPFAEEAPAPLPANPDPLAGSLTEEVQPFRAPEYEPMQPDRSPLMLMLGVTGAFLTAVSLLIVGIVAASTRTWTAEMVYACPTALLGIALSLPAWIMGHHDLAAIRAGALESSGRGRVQIGHRCGVAGTILGVVVLVLTVVAVVLS